jgi:hypothetical protein
MSSCRNSTCEWEDCDGLANCVNCGEDANCGEDLCRICKFQEELDNDDGW